jgi:hypothetical protein
LAWFVVLPVLRVGVQSSVSYFFHIERKTIFASSDVD